MCSQMMMSLSSIQRIEWRKKKGAQGKGQGARSAKPGAWGKKGLNCKKHCHREIKERSKKKRERANKREACLNSSPSRRVYS